MPSAFQKANARNVTEMLRLEQLIANLEFVNTHRNDNMNNNSWMFQWENNQGNGLSEPNIERIKRAIRARRANPANYNIKKLRKNKDEIVGIRRTARFWMYGYLPKAGKNWIKKGNLVVPPNLPANEVASFYRLRMPGLLKNAQGRAKVIPPGATTGQYRDMLSVEGTLKPAVHTARRKPSPAKRPERRLPTLKELAWKATPMSTMTNEQLRFMTQMTPMNLMMLKPKKRASPLPANNLTKYRRQAAARVIGKEVKKYQKKKPSHGPSTRSPATLARQANLGIMGGRRRSPGAANNTRITWSRNANGKINRFKTLENINMHLTQAQRNALLEMSENQAMNTIRQLARQR